MDEKERYQKAEAFATEKHKGQFRIGGEPYIMHPLAVAEIVRNQGYGMDYQITATILATFRSGSIYIPVLLILGTLFGLRGIQWTQPATDILASAISMPIAVVFLHKLPKDGLEEGAN